jgi:hypothetical protein
MTTKQRYSTLSDGVKTAMQRKNLLINGGFDIWQRGGGATADDVYTADRWYIPPSQLSWGKSGDFPTGSNWSILITPKASQQAQTFSTIELSDTGKLLPFLPNTNYTLSFQIKPNSTTDIQTLLEYADASAGGNLITVSDITTSSVVGGVFSKVVITFNTGAIVPNVTNECLRLVIRAVTTDIPFRLTQCQLEEGSVATPFEYRPIAEELALCQRYYWKPEVLHYLTVAQFTSNNLSFSGNIAYPVTMRTSPTVTASAYEPTGLTGSPNIPQAGSFILNPNIDMTQINLTLSSINTSNASVVALKNFTADAEL